MLEFIRRNARSWLVKAIFAIIVLVFVFWGVIGFQGNKKAVLATVDEQIIQTRDFLRHLDRQLKMVQQRNPDVSYDDLKQMDFKKQVFQNYVGNILLLQEARRLGFSMSREQVEKEIKSLPILQGENKQFSVQRYQALLRSNNLSEEEFIYQFRNNLLQEKLSAHIREVVHVQDWQARDFFEFVNEQVRMEYLLFNWQDYKDKVNLEEQQIQEYYQEQQENFRVPHRIQLRYIEITPQALAPYQEVRPAEIEEYYQSHKQNYTREEAVKAKHILIRLDQNATQKEVQAAREKILNVRSKIMVEGADFGEMAVQYSQGPSASSQGDLGWFNKGSMVQSFEEAAFSLEKKEISEPVRTRFGWHLIKVEDKRESGVRPLSAVKEQVKKQLQMIKAGDRLEDFLDKALDILFTTSDLQQTAEKLGIEMQTTSLFSRNKGPNGLNLQDQDLQELFALPEGEIIKGHIVVEDGYILAEKIKDQPSHIKSLQEVRQQVEDKLTRKHALQLAQEKAQDLLQDLRQGKTLKPKMAEQLKTSQPFNRRGLPAGLGSNPELVQDIFAKSDKVWLAKPYELSKGYALVRLDEKIKPEGKNWEEQKSFWVSNLNRVRGEELFSAYMQSLRANAEIEIKTPDVLEYK